MKRGDGKAKLDGKGRWEGAMGRQNVEGKTGWEWAMGRGDGKGRWEGAMERQNVEGKTGWEGAMGRGDGKGRWEGAMGRQKAAIRHAYVQPVAFPPSRTPSPAPPAPSPCPTRSAGARPPHTPHAHSNTANARSKQHTHDQPLALLAHMLDSFCALKRTRPLQGGEPRASKASKRAAWKHTPTFAALATPSNTHGCVQHRGPPQEGVERRARRAPKA
jgi:hypothetical protein